MKSQKNKAELLVSVWNRCNNRCAFCYNQTLYHIPKDVKQHLYNCNDMLTSTLMDGFSYLRFLGGELFDGAIDKLNVRSEFFMLMQTALRLLKENKIEKINFLTSFIYKDNIDLKTTLQFFEDNGVIDKIELSTSYDEFGRFTEESKRWWWDNVAWVNKTYPKMKIDIGAIMTEPFIKMATKEWFDQFYEKIKNIYMYLIELDTSFILKDKQHIAYKQLFPKRADLLHFLIKLKNWNYYHLLVSPDGGDPYNRVDALQLVFFEEFPFPIIKHQGYLLEHRRVILEDGYIDSDVPVWTDIKRIFSKVNK